MGLYSMKEVGKIGRLRGGMYLSALPASSISGSYLCGRLTFLRNSILAPRPEGNVMMLNDHTNHLFLKRIDEVPI